MELRGKLSKLINIKQRTITNRATAFEEESKQEK